MLLRSSQTLLRLVSNQASFRPLPPNLCLRVLVSMAIRSDSHVFAGNPLLSAKHVPSPGVLHPDSAFQALKSIFLAEQLEDNNTEIKVLAFRKGRPLALSLDPVGGLSSAWHLCWMPPSRFNEVSVDSFVYLGSSEVEDVAYWAVDITDRTGPLLGNGGNGLCFVELRTLMVAAAWTDADSMGELAIAGHARALLEWHKVSRFCGYCGSNTAPTDSGRRKQCTNESCKKKIYPRVDPVVIMLVIDKENDRALLSRQSRFVPRMWSCLAGFIEPGESLEEAVRRETWEETGIEVGQVVYHSSQPWPVGPNSMPCQLMVGFFAYAKSLEIRVDKSELEDAQWHSREDVKTALTFTDYEKAQRAAAFKVNQMCKGVEKGQNLSSDFNAGAGELGPIFIPGPFAIAHHLIASWAHGTATAEPGEAPKSFSSTSSL